MKIQTSNTHTNGAGPHIDPRTDRMPPEFDMVADAEQATAPAPTTQSIFGVNVPSDADALWLLKNVDQWITVNGDQDILRLELRGFLNLTEPDLDTVFARLKKITPKPKKRTGPDEQLSAEDKFLVDAEPTDYGNAVCVELIHRGHFAINPQMGLLYYDGRRWTPENADAMLSDAIVTTLKRRAKLAIDADRQAIVKKCILNNGTITACKARFVELRSTYVDYKKFDTQHHLLNVWNGTINLRTGKLSAHAPADYITHVISVDYKPNAPQGTWLAFLATVIGDYKNTEVADYIKMGAGYSATGETREHNVFYLWGAKGRNGKGTYADALQAVMGTYAAGCNFNSLTRARDGGDQGFDIAGLRGARMVFTSESGKESKLNESSVKALAGGDTLQVAHKGKDPFTFKPIFKFWAMSNHPPKGDTIDDAFWARIHMIEFPNSYLGKEDKALRDRLMEPTAQEGILAWLVEGAAAWYATGSTGLKAPATLATLVQHTRDSQDSVRAWVKADCMTLGATMYDKSVFTTNGELYAAYIRWCNEEERDDTASSQDAMGKRLAAMGFVKDKVKGTRGYNGIRPKTDQERGYDPR